MQQVRCTNCGSTAIIPDGNGEFCRCEACGGTFLVAKAAAFSKVELDHTQDIKAWREYLAKQLRLQQESAKARNYDGVKLFARKILSVLPDDFCALYYVALAEMCEDNDVAYLDFLANSDLSVATEDEKREVVDSVVLTAEPKYTDEIKAFIKRVYPDSFRSYEALLERNIKNRIQKMRYASECERDVFICHRTAAPDQDVADAICTRLEARGLRCWIAPRNILAGSQNYERDIIKGVENCRIFLLVSSFKSIYSEDCEKELKAAVLADKALYSFKIDDTEYDGTFKKALSSVQWLDACDDPYSHLEQLVIDIKGMLAEDEHEKAKLEEKRFAAREKERLETEKQRERDRDRLDRIERMMQSGVTAPPSSGLRSRLKRAEIEVQSAHFDRAVEIVDDVLDSDPENPLCWWLLLLCDFNAANDDELLRTGKDFTVNTNFKNANRFADETFARRINSVLDGYRLTAVKHVMEALDAAESLYRAEDYRGLSVALDGIAENFTDENGIIFVRFPDLASRYYWLRLWSKYKQNHLVCVEDITREREYKAAVKYASPAQSAEYERAVSTVSKNAQLFLRERSKKRSNDSKLSDYLVDNKGILPADIYNYYSSMLYFRKMLSQLSMTEETLRSSTADIATNEYFMLAQALATDAQKKMYDDILARLEANRQKKSDDFQAEKQHNKISAEKQKTIDKSTKTVSIILAIASYILFVVGLILFVDSSSSVSVLFTVSAGLRIGYAAINMPDKGTPAIMIINFAVSMTVIMICIFSLQVKSALVVSTISAVFELVALSKYAKSKKGR